MLLHVERLGSGPPLVILHGLLGRARHYRGIAKPLAAHHTVLLTDIRNHGDSPHAAGMSYAEQANDVAETLAHLGYASATIVGHSMGGKTAMAMALLHPERVDRLIVIDMAPIHYPDTARQVIAAMLAIELRPDLTPAEADATLKRTVPEPGVRAYLIENLAFHPAPHWHAGIREIAGDIAGVRGWPEELVKLRWHGAARFLRAERSLYITTEGRAAIRAAFPRAEFATIPGVSHMMHVEYPEAVIAAMGLTETTDLIHLLD